MSSFNLRLYIEDELPTDKLSKSAKVLGWKMAPWGKMLAIKPEDLSSELQEIHTAGCTSTRL